MTLIERDLGTPAPRGASRDAQLTQVELEIDGQPVRVAVLIGRHRNGTHAAQA